MCITILLKVDLCKRVFNVTLQRSKNESKGTKGGAFVYEKRSL